MRRRIPPRLIPILLILLGLAIFALLIASKPKNNSVPVTESATQVQGMSLILGNNSPRLRLYATVSSPTLANISAAVEADVESTPLLSGDTFTANQLLLKLDTRELQLQLQQREAELKEARAQLSISQRQAKNESKLLEQEQTLLNIAKANLKRTESLSSQSLASEAMVDDSRQALAQRQISLLNRQTSVDNQQALLQQLQARVDQAAARLKNAELNMQRAQIRLPHAGRVNKLLVSAGERVRPGVVLLQVYDSQQLELLAQLPAAQASLLQASDKKLIQAQMSLQGMNHLLALDRLGAGIDNGQGSLQAYFKLPALPHTPPLGEILELRLQLPEIANSVELPAESLYGTDKIYKIVNSRLQAIKATLHGEGSKPGWLLVSSDALHNGDVVLINKFANAMDGLKVELRD